MNYNAWTRLGPALEWYRSLGYEYVDLPWIVPVACVEHTLPKDAHAHVVTVAGEERGSLVGSGEQSFIHALAVGTLPAAEKLMTCTPCFRTEVEYDGVHVCPQFMKVELFVRSAKLTPEDVARHAQKFMYRWCPGCLIVATDAGFDLMYNGLELGSYGYRSASGVRFVYGTGLAEPRTTNAKQPSRMKNV